MVRRIDVAEAARRLGIGLEVAVERCASKVPPFYRAVEVDGRWTVPSEDVVEGVAPGPEELRGALVSVLGRVVAAQGAAARLRREGHAPVSVDVQVLLERVAAGWADPEGVDVLGLDVDHGKGFPRDGLERLEELATLERVFGLGWDEGFGSWRNREVHRARIEGLGFDLILVFEHPERLRVVAVVDPDPSETVLLSLFWGLLSGKGPAGLSESPHAIVHGDVLPAEELDAMLFDRLRELGDDGWLVVFDEESLTGRQFQLLSMFRGESPRRPARSRTRDERGLRRLFRSYLGVATSNGHWI